MKFRYLFLTVLFLGLVAGGIVLWNEYRRVSADYDSYRALIQQGIKIAGVDVGWLTSAEARAKVQEWVAKPYYRDLTLHYQNESLLLSPRADLDLNIPADDMVAEAVAASHQYDYWEGFKQWIQGEAITLDLDLPLQMTFDEEQLDRFLADVARNYDVATIEPRVEVKTLTFTPGTSGHYLNASAAAKKVNELVLNPAQREVRLPVSIVEPDRSLARIRSMLCTLALSVESLPTPPSFYTATIPISTTGGIAGTPLVTYTGELTWTFPQFVGYDGPLTQTTGFFFDPGKPGYTFDVDKAVSQVELAFQTDMTKPITFELDLVLPPTITPGLLLPLLKTRLARFPGITSILVKNLDTSEMVYESQADYILSGMSIAKVAIMVEVYRYFRGVVDEQIHQELLDMMGSQSCNSCANRLLAAVGGGSGYTGAERVTKTMQRLGLENFRFCAPYRREAWWDAPQISNGIVWTASANFSQLGSSWFAQSELPDYDRCIRTTPREMANLMEMIYLCTQEQGLIRKTFPEISSQMCQEMIDIMAANDLRNMLGAGIPRGVKIAHKHGYTGTTEWGDTRGEVGIIFSRRATYLISFCIWQDTTWIDFGIMQPLYRDVSNMIYNYFNPDESYWPLPPWTPPPTK